ncbi:hypothetical protein BGZ65_004403 [Modicella reniformis]|uniref:Uncharacterized protein n=1 Tax=Modicella reniformis TaxID=1440133 RepID=A0A9P6IYY9_9FUNG|nr:hypothetical protein BGZ65_004403 [Modicella reniformis]
MTVSAEVRSEIEDNEYDLRRDPEPESTTEYETSMETFAGLDSGDISSFGRAGGNKILHEISRASRQSVESSLDTTTTAAEATGTVVSATPVSEGLEPDISLTQPIQHQQPSLEEINSEELQQQLEKDITTVSLTEEKEAIIREMLGGITGSDDWAIIVYLATMVDKYERSKEPEAPASNEP